MKTQTNTQSQVDRHETHASAYANKDAYADACANKEKAPYSYANAQDVEYADACAYTDQGASVKAT